MTYRNRALLDLARLAPHCMVPGCGVRNDGSIVAMHRNEGKGMGLKRPDFEIAMGCWKCHTFIDTSANLTREDRRALWMGAYWNTLEWLWTSGLVCVATEPVAKEAPTARQVVRKPRKSRALASGPKIAKRPFPKGPSRPIPKRPFGK